jgi:hypothetical protein
MLARWTHCRVASVHKLGHIVDKLNWARLLLNSGSLDFTCCTFGATSGMRAARCVRCLL